jgi:putative endonuclease
MFRNLLRRIAMPRRPEGKDAFGLAGEILAARYARRKLRMRVVARRVLCPNGELDLVAFDKGDLVFIEVRTRETEDFGPPELTLGKEKIAAIRRSAQWFTRTRRLGHYPMRLDVIAVVWPRDGRPQLRYHKNAHSIAPGDHTKRK